MAESAPHPAGHRILVVEDNRAIREPLVALLEKKGFSARGVANGREALQTLRDGYEACLILLDLNMPIMDGKKFRAVQEQDERLATIPVAVLTALEDPLRAADTLGAVAGFAKPLDPAQLLRLVSQHCPHAER